MSPVTVAATRPIDYDTFATWLRQQGRSAETIRVYRWRIRGFERSGFADPESYAATLGTERAWGFRSAWRRYELSQRPEVKISADALAVAVSDLSIERRQPIAQGFLAQRLIIELDEDLARVSQLQWRDFWLNFGSRTGWVKFYREVERDLSAKTIQLLAIQRADRFYGQTEGCEHGPGAAPQGPNEMCIQCALRLPIFFARPGSYAQASLQQLRDQIQAATSFLAALEGTPAC